MLTDCNHYFFGYPSSYSANGVGDNLGLLLGGAVLFLVLAWVCGQWLSTELSEGRPLTSILFHWMLSPPTESSAFTLGTDIRATERAASLKDLSVRVYKCSKSYKQVQALKEVTVSTQQKSCFCILGPNGAEKSSFIKLITGKTQPTHGKVYISGHDVETDLVQIQQLLGVCEQQEFFWDELSAAEHVQLFAALKGIDVTPTAIVSILSEVMLEKKRQQPCA